MKKAILLSALIATGAAAPIENAAAQSSELKFELAAMPEFQKYAALLTKPGYAAVALETNDLSPSITGKLTVKEAGRAVETRNVIFRFVEQKGAVYTYEAGIVVSLGVAESRLTIPVVVDATSLGSGRVNVTVKPPLGALVPQEWKDRIKVKTSLVANPAAQRKVAEYLAGLSKTAGGNAALFDELILVDGYNRGAGPLAGRDGSMAVPLSDQWLLLLTLAIWLVVIPVVLVVFRVRHRHDASV
jgi:hypothetical protein